MVQENIRFKNDIFGVNFGSLLTGDVYVISAALATDVEKELTNYMRSIVDAVFYCEQDDQPIAELLEEMSKTPCKVMIIACLSEYLNLQDIIAELRNAAIQSNIAVMVGVVSGSIDNHIGSMLHQNVGYDTPAIGSGADRWVATRKVLCPVSKYHQE